MGLSLCQIWRTRWTWDELRLQFTKVCRVDCATVQLWYNSTSLFVKGVRFPLNRRWAILMSWHNYRHWFQHSREDIDEDYTSCFSRSCRHVFYWLTDITQPSSLPICLRNILIRILLGLRHKVMNVCVIHGWEMSQKLVTVTVEQRQALLRDCHTIIHTLLVL